jgi:hypothetical protein
VGTAKVAKKGSLKYKLVVLKGDGGACWEDSVGDRVLPEGFNVILGVELAFDEAGEKITNMGPMPLPSGMGARLFEVRFLAHRCTQPGDTVVVVGGASSLGAWDPHSTPVRLETDKDTYPLWRGTLKVCSNVPVQYKLVVLTADGRACWEEGIANRALPEAPTSQDKSAAVEVYMKFDEDGEQVTEVETTDAPFPLSRESSVTMYEPDMEPGHSIAASWCHQKDATAVLGQKLPQFPTEVPRLPSCSTTCSTVASSDIASVRSLAGFDVAASRVPEKKSPAILPRVQTLLARPTPLSQNEVVVKTVAVSREALPQPKQPIQTVTRLITTGFKVSPQIMQRTMKMQGIVSI